MRASSPRPWRCFWCGWSEQSFLYVFSTSVEVFPVATARIQVFDGLLHVRGGVSVDHVAHLARLLSSPRPWRCFRNDGSVQSDARVFSTSVEVFLAAAGSSTPKIRLLHVRGGVSGRPTLYYAPNESSPRPWRCFPGRNGFAVFIKVFSTSVEVFLPRPLTFMADSGLLHVRGGVSPVKGCLEVRDTSSPLKSPR